jgi:AraC-like DNA-binding protein
MTKKNNSTAIQPITVLHKEIPALAGINQYQCKQAQCIFVHAGVLAIIGEDGRYFIPPRHAFIIPANYLHEVVAKTAINISIFYFDSKQSKNLSDQCTVLVTSNLIQTLMSECINIPTDYQWQATEGRLLRLIRDKLSSAPSVDTYLPYPKDQRLTDITEKLLKHPSLKSDLISWGKFVNASSRTLSRVFKKETEITYSEWRQRLNIQIAIKHLSQGESINSIAKLLGYESSSAFIYMFKKQMGVSPNQFLKH